jgi:hypothetical protein
LTERRQRVPDIFAFSPHFAQRVGKFLTVSVAAAFDPKRNCRNCENLDGDARTVRALNFVLMTFPGNPARGER